jgi:hypothetical protein
MAAQSKVQIFDFENFPKIYKRKLISMLIFILKFAYLIGKIVAQQINTNDGQQPRWRRLNCSHKTIQLKRCLTGLPRNTFLTQICCTRLHLKKPIKDFVIRQNGLENQCFHIFARKCTILIIFSKYKARFEAFY